MKRIIVPVNKGRLSENFCRCSHYELFEIGGKNVTKRDVAGNMISEDSKNIDWLKEMGATDIICYNIDNKLIDNILGTKINLFVGIPLNTTKAIIDSYLNGNLKSNTSIIKKKKNINY